MRIGIASDLHTEMWRTGIPTEIASELTADSDVLILAGDVGSPRGDLEGDLRRLLTSGIDVVYVAGNHEFYGPKAIPLHAEAMDRLSSEHPHFHFLENRVVEIRGVRFAGTTLWFGDPDRQNATYAGLIPDFRVIQPPEPTWRWIAARHRAAQRFLFHEAGSVDVVVTHHLPSWSLITERWKGQVLNRFFATEAVRLVTPAPRLWAFGHTHDEIDQTIGPTRFVCHPRGYPTERGRNGAYVAKVVDLDQATTASPR